MTNNWNIPKELEQEIRLRDKKCVYCHKEFKSNFKDRATWEHKDNNAKNVNKENICLCCASCNSSKGTKMLNEWLNSNYCKIKKITMNSILNEK